MAEPVRATQLAAESASELKRRPKAVKPAPTHPLLELQRTAGNRAVARVVEARLAAGRLRLSAERAAAEVEAPSGEEAAPPPAPIAPPVAARAPAAPAAPAPAVPAPAVPTRSAAPPPPAASAAPEAAAAPPPSLAAVEEPVVAVAAPEPVETSEAVPAAAVVEPSAAEVAAPGALPAEPAESEAEPPEAAGAPAAPEVAVAAPAGAPESAVAAPISEPGAAAPPLVAAPVDAAPAAPEVPVAVEAPAAAAPQTAPPAGAAESAVEAAAAEEAGVTPPPLVEAAAPEAAPQAEQAAAEQAPAVEKPAEGKATKEGAAPGEAEPAAKPVAAAAAAAGAEPAAVKRAPTSPEEDPAFQAVVAKTRVVARQQAAGSSAPGKASQAQAAAPPPANEVATQAAGAQVGKMADQEAKPFDRAAFKAALLERIEALSPKTLKEADDFKSSGKAAQIKGAVTGEVAAGKETAQGAIKGATEALPDPSAATPKVVEALPPTPPGPPPPPVGAARAAPKPKTEAEVSLDEGPASVDAEMERSGVPRETLESSNEPEFHDALKKKDAAHAHAAEAPGAYRQQEQAILAGAQAEATSSSATRTQSMHAVRGERFGQVVGDQTVTMTADETRRAEVGARIEEIYQDTKGKVEARLKTLDEEVNRIFDAGAEAARRKFESYVDDRMRRYKKERYSGLIGKGRWLKDKFLGLPSTVNAFYREGRQLYVGEMDAVIDKVATAVETGLNEATGLIATGRQKVQEYVDGLPKDLKKVGQQAAEAIQSKFDSLKEDVKNKEGQLVDSLAQKYVKNLKAVDARIEEMKAANRGLVDKALDVVKGVVKTILKLKDLLLGILAKAAAVIGKIIKDPIGFVGNLVSGVKMGLQRFTGNLWTHLKTGILGWLFGALAEAGLTIPEKFDFKGILGLVLQVLGLTYANIRARAVKIVGEEVVKRLEQAAEIFKILITEGPAGLWRFIKEKLVNLKDMVLDGIKTFIMERVIIAGITWVIGLLNPASAFIKACKAIYDIVMFFITRAAQIAALVNAILDSLAAIASGALSAMAAAVENALAKAIPVVIGFLAALLGLGGISNKIREIIQKIQAPINKAIDWVIHQAVKLVKKVGGLFKSKKEDPKPAKKADDDPAKAGKIEAGLAEIDKAEKPLLDKGKISREEAEKVAASVKRKHPVFTSIRVVDGGETWDYRYSASPDETKKGEKKEEGDKPKVADLIGKKVAQRLKTKDDRPLLGPPDGYVYATKDGSMYIRHAPGKKGVEGYPEVHIDENGYLKKGAARSEPDLDQIVKDYKEIIANLKLGKVSEPAWSEPKKQKEVDDYRENLRQKVLTKWGKNLKTLDEKVLSSGQIPAKYNKIRGEIFEQWVGDKMQGVDRTNPRPTFKATETNLLEKDRQADGRMEGEILVEVKAIESARPPGTEELAQMVDYSRIVGDPGIPWITFDSEGKKTEKKFRKVKYFFNNVGVAKAWKGSLDTVLSTSKYLTQPEV